LRSTPDTQDKGHKHPKTLIDRDKKESGEYDHEDDEAGRNQGFAPCRPSHFTGLGAHLLNKLEGVCHRTFKDLFGDFAGRAKKSGRGAIKATRRVERL
jgi:hypothetical protein